jgi:NAD(P)-dependent dehydrogenase (short-subunit alcohol dehydrogenase family)
MASLASKVALVTGASRGIGADISRMLALEGVRVVCCARTERAGQHPLEGSLDQTVASIRDKGGEAVAVQANLARDEDCERVVDTARDTYGPVDILINNAAVAFFGPTTDLPVSRWVVSWRVTVHATFLLSKLVLPGMIERGWGRIINSLPSQPSVRVAVRTRTTRSSATRPTARRKRRSSASRRASRRRCTGMESESRRLRPR